MCVCECGVYGIKTKNWFAASALKEFNVPTLSYFVAFAWQGINTQYTHTSRMEWNGKYKKHDANFSANEPIPFKFIYSLT